MTLRLDIGPENSEGKNITPVSPHVMNLKYVDAYKKEIAHENVSLNLKDEIRSEKQSAGRICIVGEVAYASQGLGRLPMVAAALMIILVLNLGQLLFLGKKQGNEALVLAGEAFTSLKDAGSSALSSGEVGADLALFEDAEVLFSQAEAKANFLLSTESEWLAEPKEVQSLRHLLEAGTEMAELGRLLSDARTSFETLPAEGSLTDYLRSISERDLEPAAAKLSEINILLDQVDLSGTEFEEPFAEVQDKLEEVNDLLNWWLSIKEPVYKMLGDRYPQRYLVLLMNNDELRPGGGFIGSFVLLDLNDGRIENMEFHDVYEYDNRTYEHIEVPIHELRHLTPEWRLRDSNIYADFPSSAQEAARFLELEGGPGVDGVLGVNLSAAQSFLEVTGPLTLSSLPKPLTAETFPVVLSTLVEAKVYGQHSPKEVVGELVDNFIAAIDSPEDMMGMGRKVLEEAQKKQIMFYHSDPEVQEVIADFGLDASLPNLNEVEGDFLMPIFTNIGANKADRYMETGLRHQTHIFDDGSIVNELTLTRRNNFNSDVLAWLKKTTAEYGFTNWSDHLENVAGASDSRTGIRLYIPEGSALLETRGILRDEIQFFYDPAEDLSYYYIYQTLAPGEEKTVTLLYTLPWSFRGNFKEHSFHLFKQPGLKNVSVEKTLTAASELLLSSTPLPTETRENVDYILQSPFKNDLSMKWLFH